jgi:two-component system, NtrC family, sensor kinase
MGRTLGQLFARLSIFRKISYGYSLSIGIAIFGTGIGLVIGNQAAEKAQQRMTIADTQETLLNDLTTATLSVRMHPQRLLAVVEDSIWFQYETSKFTNDVNRAKELLAELDAFAEHYPSQLAVETQQLEEFIQTYTQTIAANSQFTETLWQRIDPQRLKSAKQTAQAPQQILLALNQDETIKLRLEFDRLSENLVRIKQSALNQQTAAEEQLAQANAIRLNVIFFSMVLSSVISIVLAVVISRAIARPIQTLNQVAQRSVQESNFNLQAPITTGDEIGTLSHSFNQLIYSVKQLLKQQQSANDQLELYNHTLEQKVEERTQELSEKNGHLNQLLEELRRTQTQMVQSEKMSSLGQLVAGVAHEINNPVNFIHGNIAHVDEYTQDLLKLIEIYQQYCPTSPMLQTEIDKIDLDFVVEDLPKILRSMKVGTERIREIVLSLRNFSRLDEAEFKAVDIHEGIDNTLMILWHRLKARAERPEIQVIKEYAQLPLVECYAGQLNQVFMNLLANAIDALEESNHARSFQDIVKHPNSIHIKTQHIAPNRISIAISDNGRGIPEANQAHLFNPFFTTKPIGKGTGLGLSISYQIVVEKHCGKMTCNSQPGQGTTFVIEIPVRQPSVEDRTEAVAKSA